MTKVTLEQTKKSKKLQTYSWDDINKREGVYRHISNNEILISIGKCGKVVLYYNAIEDLLTKASPSIWEKCKFVEVEANVELKINMVS